MQIDTVSVRCVSYKVIASDGVMLCKKLNIAS